MITRRQFIKSGAAAAGAVAASGILLKPRRAYAFSQSPNLQLWQTTLRGVGPGGIPVAAPDGFPAPVTNVTHYTIDINPYTDTLHPALGSTDLFGYNPAVPLGGGTQPQKHLGGIFVVNKGVPIQVTYRNNLPATHIIPVDITVPGDWFLAPANQVRMAVHQHGGHVPWISDGGPFDWWTKSGAAGQCFLNNSTLNPTAAANEAEYYYPNDQSARLVWYHDHAFGMDRLSAYAGVASAYVIRDDYEGGLRNSGLPDYIENGGRELPLVFQDKIFCGSNILATDPTWPGPTNPGDLWYAHVYDTARYGKLGATSLGLPPDPSTVPEYFGDTMLVNGTVYPHYTVEARRYRLRILNACNSRFMNLQLYVADATANGITLNNKGNPINSPALNAAAPNPTGRPTANWFVIGTEGGFLPNPAYVPTNVPFGGATIGSLFLASAERADVIFDFSPHVGQSLILYSDAPAPFPVGDPRNDYFPGLNINKNPVNGLTPAGFGPNTRILLRLDVVAATSSDSPLGITKTTDLTAGNDPLHVPVGNTTIPAGYTPRQLTLNEAFDGYGRLIQKIGTNVVQAGGGFGLEYIGTPTETPLAGTTEVWQIANLTGDTHPIHFHLSNVQIISRQRFAVNKYNGVPSYTAPVVPPAAFEAGWKETVRMNPGEVTTVIMKFVLPTVPFTIPSSPRTTGNEYVWHCHILEHEEHDMMRPLVVI